MTHARFSARRIWTFALLAAGLTTATLLCTGSAFRDNDQAALISGALQLLCGQVSPLHSTFYNYDKQWGSYALLFGAGVAIPLADPILRGNVVQVALLLPAMILALWTLGKSRLRIWTYVPVFLSPALILYVPFLATASLSLAFLFFSYYCLRRHWRLAAIASIAIAAACRGDVVLVAPLIILTSVSRRSLKHLVRSTLAWMVCAAAILPIVLGKLITARTFSDLAGFSFNPALVAGFVTFGLGLGAVLVLLVMLLIQFTIVARKPSWRFFYIAEAAAVSIPILFYWTQLYSPRYFFLTLIALLFFATSRRAAVTTRQIPRPVRHAVVAVSLAPWLIGVWMPTSHHIRPAFLHSTTFPTADGLFPMGAGAGFIAASVRDHLEIDHNQKTWDSARSVDYSVCGATVPVMATPMSYYLDLAIRLQGKTPARIVDLADAPCGGAYADLRAIVRHDSTGMEMARADIRIVSTRPELGRPIVWIAKDHDPSLQTQQLRELEKALHGKDAEVFMGAGLPTARLEGLHYFFLSNSDTGWAHTVFPDYMNK